MMSAPGLRVARACTTRRSPNLALSSSSPWRRTQQQQQQRRRHATTVVSRQQWKEYLAKHNPQLKPSTAGASKTKVEDKPWPRYIIWTGYALAATVIPYTVLWIGLTNESTRAWILSHTSTAAEEALRRHFGQADPHAVAYTDDEGVPHALMDELPRQVRQNQARIEQALQTPTVVRLCLYDPTTMVVDATTRFESANVMLETQLELPATEKATHAALWEKLQQQQESKQTLTSLKRQTTAMAIDFPVQKSTDTPSWPEEEHDEETTTLAEIDPLRTEARVYSLWHYQPAAPDVPTASSTGQSFSPDDLRASRLHHEIAVLEQELKNSTVATRPIDDITDELASKRAELRQLQWKKWWPWR